MIFDKTNDVLAKQAISALPITPSIYEWQSTTSTISGKRKNENVASRALSSFDVILQFFILQSYIFPTKCRLYDTIFDTYVIKKRQNDTSKPLGKGFAGAKNKKAKRL
jgi:hypothetical protein